MVEEGEVPRRVISPIPSRELTTLESLASTFSASWSAFNLSAAPFVVPIPLSTTSNPHPITAKQIETMNGNDWVTSEETESDPVDSDERQSTRTSGGGQDGVNGSKMIHPYDHIVWSAWDRLTNRYGQSKRVLVIAYAPNGLAIWDCSTLGPYTEILNLPSLDSALSPSLACLFPRSIGRIISAIILPPSSEGSSEYIAPLVAILTRENDDQVGKCHLVLYSLASHQIVKIIEVPGQGQTIKCNSRFLVIATSTPVLALHLYSTSTFDPLPSSPLLDLAANPFNGSPVFDLGRGGRYLTYATTTPLKSTRNHSPLRAGSGILAQTGHFDVDNHEDELGVLGIRAKGWNEGKRVGEKVVRKVGEVAWSGAKVIGEMGMSYWIPTTTRATTTTLVGGEEEDVAEEERGSDISKSAPLPTLSRFMTRSTPLTTRQHDEGKGDYSGDRSTDGTVIVIDLLASQSSTSTQPFKVLAHFRSTSHPLALVSLSPSSAFLLTASSQGHFVDVFEMKPNVVIGRSATGGELANETSIGKVLHRYRLNRGITAANTISTKWGDDSKLVAIGTEKGTMHVFAISPSGGKPVLEHHFQTKVINASELQPLSVTLSSVAKIRRRTIRNDGEETMIPLPINFVFVSKSDSLASAFSPSPPPLSSASTPHTSRRSPPRPLPTSLPSTFPPSTAASSFQDCLLFDPTIGTVVLTRLSIMPAPVSAEATLAAAGRAVSGLTQLMNNRGNHYSSKRENVVKAEWVVGVSEKAEWKLGRQSDWDAVQTELESMEEVREKKRSGRYGAQIEIETFSRSPLVLPRSIYLSPQFTFNSLIPSPSPSPRPVDPLLPSYRRLELRTEVQVFTSLLPPPSSHSTSNSIDISSSFEEPLSNAMTTLSSPSPSRPASFPIFPNGLAGRQGGKWTDRSAMIGESLNRVRKEINRVRLSSSRPASLPLQRGNVSLGGGLAGGVSFETDVVFADEEEEASETTSAGRTSASASAGTSATSNTTGCASEDEGSEGLDEEEGEEAEQERKEELPFEDDFDDFSRERCESG